MEERAVCFHFSLLVALNMAQQTTRCWLASVIFGQDGVFQAFSAQTSDPEESWTIPKENVHSLPSGYCDYLQSVLVDPVVLKMETFPPAFWPFQQEKKVSVWRYLPVLPEILKLGCRLARGTCLFLRCRTAICYISASLLEVGKLDVHFFTWVIGVFSDDTSCPYCIFVQYQWLAHMWKLWEKSCQIGCKSQQTLDGVCASESRRLLYALNCWGQSQHSGDQQMSHAGYCKPHTRMVLFSTRSVPWLFLSDRWRWDHGVSRLLPHNLCVHPQNTEAIALIPQSPLNTSCWQHWHSTTSLLSPAVLTTICICSSPGCGKVVSFFPQNFLSIPYVPLMSLFSPTWIFPHW